MRTAAVASIVLPPVAFLVAATVVLLGLVTLVALVARRRRDEDVEADAALPAVEVDQDEAARSLEHAELSPVAGPHQDDLLDDAAAEPQDDPRALRLLVRTLEAAIEELSADLVRTTQAQVGARSPVADSSSAGPSALADAVAALRQPEAVAARRAQVIGEALHGVDVADLAARLNAAMARSGAARSFARPALAACPGVALPALEAPARVPDGPVDGAPGHGIVQEGAVAGGPDADPDSAPQPVAVPAEPQRVLPVPAPPAAPPPARRRLFRRRVA